MLSPKDVLRVFPLNAETLKPKFPGWPKQAVPVTDKEHIENWRKTYHDEIEWGVATGPSGLIVVDLDVKHGHNGIASWKALEEEFGPADPTFRVRTKSGGLHLYFAGQCRCSAGRVGPGVDIRSDGGYVVYPNGRNYTIDDKDNLKIAPAPDWLLRLVKPPRVHLDTPRTLDLEADDLPVDVQSARRVIHHWPVPEPGERNDSIYRLACAVRDRGVSAGTAETMIETWMLEKGVSDEGQKLSSIVLNAWRYAEGVAGARSVVAEYEDVEEESIPPEAPVPEADAWSNGDDRDLSGVACGKEIASVNREWFMALYGGQMRWFHHEYDPALGYWVWRDYPEKAFLAVFNARFLTVTNSDGSMKLLPLGKFWNASPHRRHYRDGVSFDPATPGTCHRFNFWQGLAVTPAAGNWDLLKGHIRDNICSGNEEWFQYVLRWLAFAVQNPGVVPEVALILHGLKGCGKSVLGHYMARIFGSAGKCVAGSHMLSGQFSGHMKDVVFLCVDEVGWAGDQAGADRLKDRITNPHTMIEKKGLDAYPSKNCLHVMITSNHDWIVNVTSDERRFAFFSVRSDRIGDHTFWDAVRVQMNEQGGLEAMTHDLLSMDLTGTHPRKDIPRTDLFLKQISASLSLEASFWQDILDDGHVPDHWIYSGSNEAWAAGQCLYVIRSAVMEAFWTANPTRRRSDKSGVMGRLMLRIGATDFRPRSEDGGRERIWILPPLGSTGWRNLS